MLLRIQTTTQLLGTISMPGSKSQIVRATILALLASGNSIIRNTSVSNDVADVSRVCQALGLVMESSGTDIKAFSHGLPLCPNSSQINSGNSGITTRFILPVLGLLQSNHEALVLDCGEQMRKRPIAPMVTALNELGMDITYLRGEGQLPLKISGSLNGGKVTVDGATSQYLSGLLLSLPCAPNDSEVRVHRLQERLYADLTLSWLTQQHIQYTHQRDQDWDIYYIKGGQRYAAFDVTIGGDYTSASYALAAAALLPGKVIVEGLDINDRQGDKRLIQLLQMMGADIEVTAHQVTVRGGKPLKGIAIDANEIPDLFPTLAVLGTQAQGQTKIYNVPHARIKETDRIHSMTQGLRRMGADIDEFADGMLIRASQLHGATVEGYDDHRTVMALAIAGFMARSSTTIAGADAYHKTYPNFVKDMQALGAVMQLEHYG